MVTLFTVPEVQAQTGGAGANNRLKSVEEQIDKSKAEAERLRRDADSLERKLAALRKQMVDAARVVQDRELDIITLEARLADLVDQEQAVLAEVAKNRGQFARVLLALQRLSRFPPEAFIVHSADPQDMVRSAILLRSAVPEIERRATKMRLDLQALSDARQATATKRLELANANTDLDGRRTSIRKLLAETKALRDKTRAKQSAADQRVAKLAGQAKNLRDLMAGLEAERQRQQSEARKREAAANQARKKRAASELAKLSPPSVSKPVPIGKRKGQLPMPVIGRISGRYGENLGTGQTRKGIEISTKARAQVVVTHDGKVAFAGTFRGYGQLLIVEHSGGYHTLLAGMREIDASVGQRVSAGQPVGTMGGAEEGVPRLYLEFRRNGRPINPLPWLAARRTRASG